MFPSVSFSYQDCDLSMPWCSSRLHSHFSFRSRQSVDASLLDMLSGRLKFAFTILQLLNVWNLFSNSWFNSENNRPLILQSIRDCQEDWKFLCNRENYHPSCDCTRKKIKFLVGESSSIFVLRVRQDPAIRNFDSPQREVLIYVPYVGPKLNKIIIQPRANSTTDRSN